MLTFVSWPKPFVGEAVAIQHRAISSWTSMKPECQTILFGTGLGVAEAARDLGVDHVPSIRTNPAGTALLDDLLRQANSHARHSTLCLVNADIVFLDDLIPAVVEIRTSAKPFLITGRCRELNVAGGVSATDLRGLAEQASLRDPGALDYFVFPRELFGEVPPFAMGRAGFDNWLVWRARNLGALVIDATEAVTAIHQRHDYGHLEGGRSTAYSGEEARHNVELAGGWLHLYDIGDATHRLTPTGIRRNWQSSVRTNGVVRRVRLAVGRALRHWREPQPGQLTP